jgi:hypothetical protein
MKSKLSYLLASLIVAPFVIYGQSVSETTPSSIHPMPASPVPGQTPAAKPLKVFDLDFPGGPPQELVKAIERALGASLNVIVSKQDADVELPALKLKRVTVPELFEALRILGRDMSATRERMVYEFVSSGPPKHETIWIFHCVRRTTPPTPEKTDNKICRFYNLKTILDAGAIKMEDLKTAVETGWTGLGVQSMPKLVFHRETGLLIAVGAPEHLMLIDDMIRQLSEGPGFYPGRFSAPRPQPGIMPNPGSVPGVVPGSTPGRVIPSR